MQKIVFLSAASPDQAGFISLEHPRSKIGSISGKSNPVMNSEVEYEMKEAPTIQMVSPQSMANAITVSREEASLIQKIQRIVKTGQNVEIKCDRNGKLKVFKVSKEIA